MELDLCAACCGSLPSSSREKAQVFRTRCCDRAICPKCLNTNPRLSRYHPCLSCLAGVGAVSSSSSNNRKQSSMGQQDGSSEVPSHNYEDTPVNLDGSLKNEDLFTLGDDEDEDLDEKSAMQRDLIENSGEGGGSRAGSPPPAYEVMQPQSTLARPKESAEIIFDAQSPGESMEASVSEPPKRHYIQKAETLLGIAFKYKVDGRTLCRLNNLPISTLSTTPHLLHTRTSLVLPYDTKVSDQCQLASISTSDKEDPAVARDRFRQRTLERAAKRFQIVTKEEDWRIANAYVALAASGSTSASQTSSSTFAPMMIDKEEKEWSRQRSFGLEKPETSGDAPMTVKMGVSSSSGLDERDVDARRSGYTELREETTARAVDAYLDDDEWEAKERARGRGPSSRSAMNGSSRQVGGTGFSSWFNARKSEKAM